MDDKLKIRDTDDLARKWRALADRRREHFADLYQSGRWRKYYREQTFLAQMRDTARMTDAWERVAPANADRLKPSPESILRSALGSDPF
jgi:uncharacterized repeat protein (TIGR03809 family)